MKRFAIFIIITCFFIVQSCFYGFSEQKRLAIQEIDNYYNQLDEKFFPKSEWDLILEKIELEKDKIANCKTSTDLKLCLSSTINYFKKRIQEQLSFSRAEQYGGGSGTIEAPFKICNPSQLLYLAKEAYYNETNNKYYALDCDIDLAGINYSPIASNSYSDDGFCGYFDGMGYVIKNMSFYRLLDYDVSYLGLFGHNKGCIKNVGIVDYNVDIIWYYRGYSNPSLVFGGICGINEGEVINCYAIGKIKLDYIGGEITGHPNHIYVGGIAGRNVMRGTINGCYSKIDIDVKYHNEPLGDVIIAGISSGNTIIKNCLSIINIETDIDDDVYYEEHFIGNRFENCYFNCSDKQDIYIYRTDEQLNDETFYISTLGWSKEIWNFENLSIQNGNYPILRKGINDDWRNVYD